jgi:hypothetical protein
MTESLPKLVDEIKIDFGIAFDCRVEAHLYKMLLYEKGGHFLRHKDTEKEIGMFGSLLIQLPAEHEGGELVVEHLKWKKEFAFDEESGDKSFYSAFYADCDHILHPVTDGYRLVLAFNLVCVGGTNLPQPEDVNEELLSKVRNAVKLWREDYELKTFAIPLEHKYSTANLDFKRLKGNDCGKVNLIRSCYNEDGKPLFKVLLMIMTKHLTFPDMYYDNLYELEYTPEFWVSDDISHEPAYENEDELCINYPESFLVGTEFDEDEDDVFSRDSEFSQQVFQIAVEDSEETHTGNEGGSCEYWYRSAFVVFWPCA